MLELTKDELKRRFKTNSLPITAASMSSISSDSSSSVPAKVRTQFYTPKSQRRSTSPQKIKSSNSSNAETNSSSNTSSDLSDSQFIGLLSPVSDGYKKKGLQPISIRSKLIELACQSSEWISLSSWEGNRKEWTPTKDVLLKIKSDYSNLNSVPTSSPIKTEVVFICGADVFCSFLKPGLWKNEDLIEILNNCYLSVLERDGFDCQKVLNEHLIFQEDNDLKNKVIFVEDELVDNLSSTFIRKQLLKGASVKYLVPDGVAEYLIKNDVYNEQSLLINSGEELAPMKVNKI